LITWHKKCLDEYVQLFRKHEVFGYSHGIRYNNVFELKAHIEFAKLHSFNEL